MKTSMIAIVIALGVAIPQQADARGCMLGAAAGAVAGHMSGHTFLGAFGGCAGGLIVHKMYVRWHRNHPNGTMKDFVADNRDRLPAGWADKLDDSSKNDESRDDMPSSSGHQNSDRTSPSRDVPGR